MRKREKNKEQVKKRREKRECRRLLNCQVWDMDKEKNVFHAPQYLLFAPVVMK